MRESVQKVSSITHRVKPSEEEVHLFEIAYHSDVDEAPHIVCHALA